MQDELSRDLPVELRLHGHRVQFRLDVTGRVKATCRTFPTMLIRHEDLKGAMRNARKEVLRLTASRMAKCV